MNQEYLRIKSQKPIEGKEYYHIKLFENKDNSMYAEIVSSWTGFTDTKPIREIREGRLYSYPMDVYNELKRFDEECLIINYEKDICEFFYHKGNGLVEKEVAKIHFNSLINNSECMKVSSHYGFESIQDMEKGKKQRAPSKKLRMKILERDNHKCKSCGRSPSNHVDLELHVHHIIPFGLGGITEKENLITLCKTCHDGLSPHYSPYLTGLIHR